jgi:hypothetical protein
LASPPKVSILLSSFCHPASGAPNFPTHGLNLENDFEDEEFEQEFVEVKEKIQDSMRQHEKSQPIYTEKQAQESPIRMHTPSSDPERQGYDEDEFIGFDAATKPENKQTDSVETIGGGERVELPEFGKRTYYLEGFYVLMLAIYCGNFWLGRRSNRHIALAWAHTFADLFRKNFSKVGESTLLTQESQNEFKMVATGRRNCTGLQATLNLKRRHDLLSLLLGLVYPVEDTLKIEIPLESEGMDPFIFAVVNNNEAKQFYKDNFDIAAYCKETSVEGEALEGMTVYTDCQEVVDELLYEHVRTTLAKYSHLFRSLHLTDQSKTYANQKKLLRFVYRLPGMEGMDELTTLLRMALHFIDLASRTKLSASAKARAEKKRAKVAEEASRAAHTQRQELAQQKKMEKKQKQQQRMASLSKEQQRKAEEKELKRQRKKRMPKFKVVYG